MEALKSDYFEAICLLDRYTEEFGVPDVSRFAGILNALDGAKIYSARLS